MNLYIVLEGEMWYNGKCYTKGSIFDVEFIHPRKNIDMQLKSDLTAKKCKFAYIDVEGFFRQLGCLDMDLSG